MRNEDPFLGSSMNPLKEMEFKSYMDQGVFQLSNNLEEALSFVQSRYTSISQRVLDTTIIKSHNKSVSFIQCFSTIRLSDGYEELQMRKWSLRILYNVDEEIVIPLTLQQLDDDPRGKYLNK